VAVQQTVSCVPVSVQAPRFSLPTYQGITHQSPTLLLGVLGGVVGQWVYATRRERGAGGQESGEPHGGAWGLLCGRPEARPTGLRMAM
jgi:hypothetical protein